MQVRRDELLEKKIMREKCKSDDGKNLLFMVGFPRSGTTLLDTILRSHKDIQVLEELPMVSKMEAAIPEINTIEKIEEMKKETYRPPNMPILKKHENMLILKNQKLLWISYRLILLRPR